MSALNSAVGALMRRASDTAIVPRYRTLAEADITSKAPDDVVTIADAEAEAILTEGLAALIPGAKVVGEEAAHADPSLLGGIASGTTWIVDPLDGTNNFAAGKPPFGVMVALAEGGETRAGWILDCLSGRFCRAELGGGAFIDDQHVTARATDQTPPIAAISLVFMDPARREAVRASVMPHYAAVDIPRCAAEQYPRLVMGVNDVSIFERVLPWDHAAGALLVNEAGGRVARPDGRAYRPDQQEKGLIGAASPALWDDLAARISEL